MRTRSQACSRTPRFTNLGRTRPGVDQLAAEMTAPVLGVQLGVKLGVQLGAQLAVQLAVHSVQLAV